MYKLHFFRVFLSLSIGLFLLSCQSKQISPSKPENKTDINIDQSDKITEGDYILSVPDIVPEIVNNKALEVAYESGYSNIRILQVEGTNNPTYNVYYFDDDGTPLKSYNVKLNELQAEVMKITDVTLKQSRSLAKPTDSACWKLATVYKGYNRSGSSTTFYQSTSTYGWYHKVIWNLANSYSFCGGKSYNGGFNDQISSFYWQDDGPKLNGRKARPVNFKVWEHADRNGTDWWWELPKYKCYYPTRSLSDNDFRDDFNDNKHCDNKVSSIDMFFRVFTPISGTCDIIG